MKKRQRTSKSKYKHESTGDHCTCAQYVAAIMCQKNAESKNQGSLPYKFWNQKPWDWTYKKQLYKANQLLKDFSEEALVKAVHSAEFKNIFSLNHPCAVNVIKKYELIIKEEVERLRQNPTKIEVNANPKTRSGGFSKKNNILNKLRKIQNGQEEDIE